MKLTTIRVTRTVWRSLSRATAIPSTRRLHPSCPFEVQLPSDSLGLTVAELGCFATGVSYVNATEFLGTYALIRYQTAYKMAIYLAVVNLDVLLVLSGSTSRRKLVLTCYFL